MSTERTPTSETMTSHETSAEAIAVPDPGAAPGRPAAPAAAEASGAVTETTATSSAPAAAAPVPAAEAPATPVRRTRTVALVVARRLLRLAFALALFIGGVAIGWQAFTASRPAPAVVGDPAVVGVATPPIVMELANAIAADDADRIRAALQPEIFSSYTADMERFGIATVEEVQTLGTYADGPRSATALILTGRDVNRNPYAINLVVLTQDGLIVRLR